MRPGEQLEQQEIPAWDCPLCLGTGERLTEHGLERCRCCAGTGLVDYDPKDFSVIPY